MLPTFLVISAAVICTVLCDFGLLLVSASFSSKDDHCTLYMAESALDANGYALYAGTSFQEHERIGDRDLVIPVINANKNEFSPWHHFVWGRRVEFKEVEQFTSTQHILQPILNVDYFIAGIEAMAPCSTHPNVRPNTSESSFSNYDESSVSTDILLKPGQLIVNLCNNENIQIPDGGIVQSIDFLQTNGVCVDTLTVNESTIEGIGRGAFAKYFSKKGDVVATTPLVHFDRSQMEIVEQSYKDVHRIPLFREHGIEYTSIVVGHQLLLNYCYGHPDSNLLLLPYGPGVNFINHHETEANVYIRWSTRFGDKTEYRENTPLMELYEQPATGKLMMEFVALKDIMPGDEVFLDYGPEFVNAWNQHVTRESAENVPFRHEISVPPGFYIEQWMRADPKPLGDFLASPLVPGQMAVIRWNDSSEAATPWAFRIGLPSRVRKVLRQYCDKMGITEILRHVTLEGNALKPGTETHMDLEGDDWYLQRPDSNWRSNMHWFSPGAGPAHEHYLQALSVAGFDEVLKGIGEHLGMDGLVAFHVTFIGVSYSNRGYLHRDVDHTGGKVFNIIIPLLLANETGPELDLEIWKPDNFCLKPDLAANEKCRVGRYRYEYDVASLMGDDAVHATSACDYRYRKEMRMAATVYVADVNEVNAENIIRHFTQAYPPRDIDLLKSWIGHHWKKDDISRHLPEPSPNHILIQRDTLFDSELDTLSAHPVDEL